MPNSDDGDNEQNSEEFADQTPDPVKTESGSEDDRSFFVDSDAEQTDPDENDDKRKVTDAELQKLAAQTITWEGEEFVHHQKSALWYLELFASAIVFAAIIYFLTKDILTICVIVIGVILFAVYASRKPRRIPYSISPKMLVIDRKQYPMSDYRSFSTVKEGSTHSIIFTPLKRFAPLATIYYPNDREKEIVGILTDLMPMSEFQHDAVDKLLHKIRF